MSTLDTTQLPPGLLNAVEQELWPVLQQKLNPIVWAWYTAHKDDKVTKIFKIYTIRVGSFGIASTVITNLFGPQATA